LPLVLRVRCVFVFDVWLSRLRSFTAFTPVGSVAKPKLDVDNFQARRKFNGNRFDELFPIKLPPAAANKL
jgi:hypothetical protein